MADINSTYAKRPGRWLIFIDTCHAGGVLGTCRRALNDVNAAIVEMARAGTGAMVFSSSTTGQSSLERTEWGNGAFTKALVERLGGRAASQQGQDSRITYKMLDLYVSERVKELTKGEQSPVTHNPNALPDFPVAVRQQHALAKRIDSTGGSPDDQSHALEASYRHMGFVSLALGDGWRHGVSPEQGPGAAHPAH